MRFKLTIFMALGNRLLKGKVRALQKESSLLSAITVDRKSSNIKPLRVDRQRLLLRLHIRRFEEIRRPFAVQQALLVTICTAPLPSPTSVRLPRPRRQAPHRQKTAA